MKKFVGLLPVLVALACIGSGCFGKSANPPSINSFNSNPPVIDPGSNSMLSWNVTGAETISIDNGIGTVALTGSRIVTPTVTTVYTLTATGQGKTVTATTEVVISRAAVVPDASFTVEPEPETEPPLVPPVTPTTPPASTTPATMPDLFITDVSNSGNTITYTIINQGDAPADRSITALIIDGTVKANNTVGPLGPAATSTLSFYYTYSCTDTQDEISLLVDSTNVVNESEEYNNTYSVTWPCMQQMTLIPVTLKPDLVVTEIQNNLVHFYITVYNQGLGAAGASEIEIFTVGGTDKSTYQVPPLAAGEKVTVDFFTLECENYDRHPHGSSGKVTATADIKNQVDESNENNNSSSIEFIYP